MGHLREVMHMGRRGLQAMHQTAVGIQPDMEFHAARPLVPLPFRVHLRIPRLPLVLGGSGRGENGGIHNRALRQTKALRRQMAIELGQEGLAQVMRIQQMAEAQNGALVRHPPQLHPGKATHRMDFQQRLLHHGVTQVVGDLKHVPRAA